MQALIHQRHQACVSQRDGADAPPRTPSPNGGVGVEPITSSAPHGASDLINQSGSRKAWAARYEREICVYFPHDQHQNDLEYFLNSTLNCESSPHLEFLDPFLLF